MTKVITSLLLIHLALFTNAQEWLTDFTESKSIATEKNLNIVLVFQGSDWCAPCIRMDREILSSDEFITYSKANFVMLQADFPKKKQNRLSESQQKKNNLLAEKYNRQGFFPLVVVMDKNGKVLGTTGYKKISPSEFIKLLESFSS